MGCDIHCYAEKLNEEGKYICIDENIFIDRNYSVFAFLAGVRNYSEIDPIREISGLPDDISKEVLICTDEEDHSHSFVSIKELLEFDYSQEFYDNRCKVFTNYTEYLSEYFFVTLRRLEEMKADRIVFWFDN